MHNLTRPLLCLAVVIIAAALSSDSLSPSDVTVALLRYLTRALLQTLQHHLPPQGPLAAPPIDHNGFRDPELPRPITNGTYDSGRILHVLPAHGRA